MLASYRTRSRDDLRGVPLSPREATAPRPARLSESSRIRARRLQRKLQRKVIPSAAQTANRANRKIGKVRMTSKGLPGIDVRQVDLDKRNLHRRKGIAQRDAGMGQPARG